MHVRHTVAAISAVVMLVGTSAAVFAQSPVKPVPGAPGAEESMDRGMMGGGMMGGDMRGMMNMMRGCERMSGSTAGGAMMPELPPGNEKLQFQMHAEMLQKMGEIAEKYAARIK
jgi:hypothetical protein